MTITRAIYDAADGRTHAEVLSFDLDPRTECGRIVRPTELPAHGVNCAECRAAVMLRAIWQARADRRRRGYPPPGEVHAGFEAYEILTASKALEKAGGHDNQGRPTAFGMLLVVSALVPADGWRALDVAGEGRLP